MRYMSLFSGIEAASCAWNSLGWECTAVAEIDPFPCAVLKQHYPTVPNFGDVSKFHDWPDDTNPDLIVGGSPCQAFSVAGLRKGLDDPRGNLTLTYLAVVAKYRPKWLVWENVPGVLSIYKGRVFGTFLGAMGQLGYGWAYRVCDAQYFGVPQQRRRVFVVGYLGEWQRAGAVLFEPHSLSRDSPPSRKAGQDVTGTLSARTQGGGLGTDFECQGGVIAMFAPDVSPALKARDYKGPSSDGDGDGAPLIAFNARQYPDAWVDRTGPLDCDVFTQAIAQRSTVRRITPMEAERLQGFPDGWTQVPYRGKPAADGPRYKAIGNSMAVPVMAWIGERIAMVDGIR